MRKKWSQVAASLLASPRAIPGLDESIILKPGSLHLTLGVLSLAPQKPSSTSEEVNSTVHRHTIGDALKLFQSLCAPLADILAAKGDLMVPLRHMDVMRGGPKQKLEQSHVMWAGPDPETEEGKRLSTVCGKYLHLRMCHTSYILHFKN